MSDADLVRRACATYRRQRAMGGRRVEHPLATIVCSPERPDVWDANHASGVTAAAPEEVAEVLRALDEAMPPGVALRKFFCDPFTPQPFLARLVLAGFTREATLQLVLEGELAVRPRELEIRRVSSLQDWSSVAELLSLSLAEDAGQAGRPPPSPTFVRQMLGLRREMSSELHPWLARDGGVDCGYFASWPGVEGMGMVEWLFVQRSQRRRGVGTALVAHAVADARACGAEPVLIGASAGPDAVPRRLYAALGFRPICLTEEYQRFV